MVIVAETNCLSSCIYNWILLSSQRSSTAFLVSVKVWGGWGGVGGTRHCSRVALCSALPPSLPPSTSPCQVGFVRLSEWSCSARPVEAMKPRLLSANHKPSSAHTRVRARIYIMPMSAQHCPHWLECRVHCVEAPTALCTPPSKEHG